MKGGFSMARPKKNTNDKKVRVNLTVSSGAREISKLMGMNLSSILEQAIRQEYENIRTGGGSMKVTYTNEKWQKIIDDNLY